MPSPSAPSRGKEKLRAGRIAILGRANVGKSTLLNALVGERIAITSRHPQTTRERMQGIVTRGRTQYVLVDTPGLHGAKTKLGRRMNEQARGALEGADAIVFVTDVGDDPAAREEDLAILQSLPQKAPVVLAVNKIDRVANKGTLLPVLEAHGKVYEFAAIVPVSALRRDGTNQLLDVLGTLLPESPPLFEEDVVSDKPLRFLVAEFVREQILRRTRQEVPHGIAVVVERFDERPQMTFLEMAVVVDKESHKKIVIGKGGSLLKQVGTDARARVEALLGKKVHMKLWVKAIPRWYENEAQLRELGYGDIG
jgi:GTP-binding protein Era